MEIEQDQQSSPPATSVPIDTVSELSEEQRLARLHELQQRLRFLSDQSGKEDQKDITKVLEEFLHLVIGIPHDRLASNFYDKICEIMDDICKCQVLLEALLFSDSLMMFTLKNLTFEPYLPIFLRFMDNVYSEMVRHSESGKAYARMLFSKAKKLFEMLYQSRENDQGEIILVNGGQRLQVYKYKSIFLLLCHTIVKLINLDEDRKISDDFRDIDEIYTGKKWDFSQILTEEKSHFYKSHFMTSGLYEEILNCLEIKEFQTKESALCLVLLTYCIFQGNKELLKYSEGLSYHLRFYKVLSMLEQKNPFDERDVLLTLNFLFNLASHNDFYHLFQKGIEPKDIFSPTQALGDFNSKSKYLNYISLISEDFFYVALKIIFEWTNISEDTKLCFLRIAHKMLKHSCYNTLSCAQGIIENYLLVCLRKEPSDDIKKALASILGHIFFRNTGITQFKSIARSMQYKFPQLYPKSFQELVSEPAQPNFIKNILDRRSYYMSLKYIFQKIISRLLAQNDNPENFIHFSGHKSGIIVKNLSLKSLNKSAFLSSKKEFTILIEFRSENLKSMDKKNIIYMDQQSNVQPNRNRESTQDHNCSVLGEYEITKNYFDTLPSSNASSKRPSMVDQRSSVQNNGIENYYPRLFSLTAPPLGLTVDLYISHYEGKRTIALEGKNAKKGLVFREEYETNLMENQWYSLVLTYATKNNAALYLNSQPLRRIYQTDFSPILDSIDLFQTLVIGSSLIPNVHAENFNPKTCFQGQIRNFLLLPFEINSGNTSLVLNPNQLSFRRISSIGGPRESISKKKGIKLDPEELFESSLLNLNVFIRLSKLSVREEVLWISNPNPAVISQAHRKSMVKRKDSEAVNEVQKIQIDSKGVFYIETFKFEDTLFSIGGLEAFLYCIDILTNFEGFENADQASEIMCEIFKVITMLAQKTYKEDALVFFMDNGMYELAHLIQQFVAKHNATLRLVDYIIEFLDNLHDNLLKYKGAHAFFWKFVVWESCSYDLQTQIFEKSLNLLNIDLKKNYFKQNSDTIGMLFYLHKKLRFPLDTSSSAASSKIELDNEPQELEKQGLKFRRTLIKEIITNIFYHVSDEIAKIEFLFFSKYLAACPLDINLYEALSALISLLKLCSSDISSRHISLQTLLATLYEVRFPSFLISTLLTCFNDPLTSKQDELIENPIIDARPPLKILDKIAAVTIELIDYVVLRPLLKQGDNPPENVTASFMTQSRAVKQSSLNLTQSQYSKAKSFVDPMSQSTTKVSFAKGYLKEAQNQRDLFIKLLSRCTGEGVGKESLRSFMNLIKTRDDADNILSQDRQVLNLLLNIVPTWTADIQICFLNEIIKLIKMPKNMRIFFETINFQDFIHNSIVTDNQNSEVENKDLLALRADLVRTCLGELFKLPDGFSKIIALSHIRTSDCFAKIIRLYFIDIFRKVKEILNKCDFEDQCFTNLDINSREFTANLMQLISYLAAWVTDRENSESETNLVIYEDDVFTLLELLFSVASKLRLNYATLPDFRLNINVVKPAQVITRINELPLYKNGGVFFTLLNLLIEIFVSTKNEARKNQAIKMLANLLSKKSRHKRSSLKNIKSDPDFNYEGTLIQKMENSNETLSKFLKTLNSQGYFEPIQDKTTSPHSPSESTVYGYVLHNLLKLLLQHKMTSGETNATIGSEEKALNDSLEGKLDLSLDQSTTSLPRTTASILILIQEVVGQGKQHLEKLLGDFAFYPQFEEEKSDRSLSSLSESQKLETPKLSMADLEIQKKVDIHAIRTKLPGFLEKSWERIKMSEVQRKLVNSKSQRPAQTMKQSKHRDFFANFLDLCNPESKSAKDLSSFIQGKSKSIKDADETSFEVDENIAQLHELLLNKNIEYVKQWLLPNLEESCTLVLDMVHNLSKSYYQLQKVSALDYEIYLTEDKENAGDIDRFNTAIQDTFHLKELFETEFNDWEEREKRNLARIMKKWNFQKTNLTQDRGVWQTEQSSDQFIRYKIDKAEDSLRRRVRLKKDRYAANKEYLSVAAYQERLKATATPSLSVRRGPSEPASTQTALDEQSENPEALNLDSDMPPDNKISLLEENPQQQAEMPELNLLEFHQIPKEEVLTDIKERAIEPTRNLKKLVEKWSKPCEKIALKGAVYGLLEIRDSKYITFSPSDEERSDTEPYCFGALKNAFLKNYKKRKQWKISSIGEIHARNYNLRSTGVEIFIREDAKTYFFNLYTKEAQQDFIDCVAGLNSQVVVVADRLKEFHRKNFQKKWLDGQLSNFEYLMILNTYASRSFNDINQYPVFPWIIKEFTSEFLDINTTNEEERKKIFRDLSCPIGALNPKKKSDAQEKFNNWCDDSEPAFHYGSHYSNAGSIINYLIRLEPFTSLNIDLQSGKFDQADRLFSSIKNAWHSCFNNRGDFRELTPEFFYFPEFLKDCNKLDFGRTQTNRDISSVELPAWAKTAEEFIIRHREALECDYVSSHLHEWIDLIFGYKQRGDEAIKAVNIFRIVAYEGGVDLSKIKDKDHRDILLQQIFHLGQTPTQLFSSKHPAKSPISQPKLSNYIFSREDATKTSSTRKLNMNLLLNMNPQPILYLSKEKDHVHIIFKNLELYSVPFQVKSLLYDSLKWNEVKNKCAITKLGRIVFNDFSPGNQFSVLAQPQPQKPTYIVVGGYLDNSFKILKEEASIEVLETIQFHKKIVTAVDTAHIPRVKQSLIAVGSKDCRISLWELEGQNQKVSRDTKRSPYQVLYGHHNEITALVIQKMLGLLISCDKDQVVLVFCVTSGKLLKSMYLNQHLPPDDVIKTVRVDENGFIVLITVKSHIMVYTINGQMIRKINRYASQSQEITNVSFIDKLKPYIAVAFKEAKELVILDFLNGKELIHPNNYSQWNDRSDAHLSDRKVEELLKSSAPLTMVMGESGKHLYIGYENGCVGIMGRPYEKSLEGNMPNLTQFGFDLRM